MKAAAALTPPFAPTAGNYGPPPGFNWEWGSQDEPIKDGYGFEENNVQSRVEDFVAACMDSFNHTRGNDIMLTMGTDFTYANAFVWCAFCHVQQQVACNMPRLLCCRLCGS